MTNKVAGQVIHLVGQVDEHLLATPFIKTIKEQRKAVYLILLARKVYCSDRFLAMFAIADSSKCGSGDVSRDESICHS